MKFIIHSTRVNQKKTQQQILGLNAIESKSQERKIHGL